MLELDVAELPRIVAETNRERRSSLYNISSVYCWIVLARTCERVLMFSADINSINENQYAN